MVFGSKFKCTEKKSTDMCSINNTFYYNIPLNSANDIKKYYYKKPQAYTKSCQK